MNRIEVDLNKVIEVLQRDNPAELERAMLLVRIADLEDETIQLRAEIDILRQSESYVSSPNVS